MKCECFLKIITFNLENFTNKHTHTNTHVIIWQLSTKVHVFTGIERAREKGERERKRKVI